MVTILPRQTSNWETLATGLSEGLGGLADYKVKQLLQKKEREQTHQSLKQLLGPGKEAEALAISNLDPETRGSYLKQAFKQQFEAPQQESYASALGQLMGKPQEQQQQQLQQAEQGGNPFQQSESGQQGTEQQRQSSHSPEQIQQALSYLQNPVSKERFTPQQREALTKHFTKRGEKLAPKSAGSEQPMKIAPSLPRLTERQATTLAKLGMEREKMTQRQELEAFKLTKDERKEITQAGRQAIENLEDLNRIDELNKEGKLDTAGYTQFLERSGLDIPALMNPQSQEFKKLETAFLRNAQSYVGGRVTNYEMSQFLKSIPSLSQSPEGRNRVIANLKRINRAAVLYNDALKEVMKENRNVPPLDLDGRIDEKVSKRRDQILEQFKKDLAKPVPKGQNKWITALQAGAGSLVSGIPGALKGAGKGALLGAAAGRLGGPGGMAGGAGLGAIGGLLGIL